MGELVNVKSIFKKLVNNWYRIGGVSKHECEGWGEGGVWFKDFHG